jgi:type VI secretion system secreted protein VgrG
MNSGLAGTQSDRQAAFHCENSAYDDLMLTDMVAHEQVSGLFEFHLQLSSENQNINLNSLVGQSARVEMELKDASSIREFNGIITEFSFASFRDNLAEYRAVLRPWFWLLTCSSDNRIFQNQTVPEIIEAVCALNQFDDIKLHLDRTYAPRDYCVQYKESDFAFLTRLMEEEGIYYYFEHEAGKHHLILVDDMGRHQDCPEYETVKYYPPDEHNHREEQHLDCWTASRSFRTASYILRSFDFLNPGANLEVVANKNPGHAHARFENYEYPARFADDQTGNPLASRRLEEAQRDLEILHGQGNARGLRPGYLFELDLFPRDDENRPYLILKVTHRLALGGFDSGGQDQGETFNYRCTLEAMPQPTTQSPDLPHFRPPRVTVKPVVYGPQTAMVVGQANEDITTDQYGRIKVKFHWDRDPNKDQNSSCWVRVSQAWAGKQWGAQFIPRIGQEVIVEFLEGDPDRPIVTGSVYNASNMPPYALPANATQSGIKTRSSKGGTASNFNEIRFEDKKDQEELYIHAEKNMKVEVENDRTENVGNDETVTIGNNRHHTVDVNDTRIVEGNDRTEVTGTQHVITDGLRDIHVKNEEIRNVDRSQTETVGRIWKKDVGGNIDIESTRGNITIDALGGNITIEASGNALVKDSNHIDISNESWSITGVSGGITGVAMALAGTNNAVNGQALTVNAVNIAFYGLDTGVTGAELKKALVETKATVAALKKVGTELKSVASIIKNGGIDIDLSGMIIM